MRHAIAFTVVAVVFTLLAGPVAAYAQDVVTAEVPFKFMASGKTHEPGKYEFRLSEDKMGVTLTPAKGTPNMLLAITRLAALERPSAESRIVFDKVGGTYYLSEVWLPGEEGYLVHSTKEPHTHHIIKLVKK